MTDPYKMYIGNDFINPNNSDSTLNVCFLKNHDFYTAVNKKQLFPLPNAVRKSYYAMYKRTPGY